MAETWPHFWHTGRGFLTRTVAGIPAELTEAYPPGCRNNLRWQLGHAVLSSEMLVCHRRGNSTTVPPAWVAWFGRDTSPADFTAETPSWAELTAALTASTAHLTAWLAVCDPTAALTEPLVAPQFGLDVRTVAQAVHFASAHEAIHFGQMAVYQRVLGSSEQADG